MNETISCISSITPRELIIPESILWNFPGCIVFKDINSQFLGANKNFTKLTGFKSLDDLVGKNDYLINSETNKHANTFILQDREVISGKELLHLDFYKCADNIIHVFLTQRSVWFNPEGKIGGTTAFSMIINQSLIDYIYRKLTKNCIEKNLSFNNIGSIGSYKINSLYEEYKLSDREAECLFYLLHGGSAINIAQKCNISSKTVEKHIEKLKIKFSCYTKSQLIEKTINIGFLSCIPKNILGL